MNISFFFCASKQVSSVTQSSNKPILIATLLQINHLHGSEGATFWK